MEHSDRDNNPTIDSRDLAVVVYRKHEENAYYPDFELDLRLEEDEPEERFSRLGGYFASLKEKFRIWHEKQDELMVRFEKHERQTKEVARQTKKLEQDIDNLIEATKLDHPEMIPFFKAKEEERELARRLALEQKADQERLDTIVAKQSQNGILTEAIGAKTLKAAEKQPDETVFEPAQRGKRRLISFKQTFCSETYVAVEEQLGDTAFKQVQTDHSVLKKELKAEVLQAGENKPGKSFLQQIQITYSVFSQAMNESDIINPTTVERENAGGDQADEIVYDMLSERSTDAAAGDPLKSSLFKQMQKIYGILSKAVNDPDVVQVASPTAAEDLQAEEKPPAGQSNKPKGLIPAAASVANSGCLMS